MSKVQLSATQCWLALRLIPRLASNIKISLINEYSIAGIFNLTSLQLRSLGLNAKQVSAVANPNLKFIKDIERACSRHNISLVCYQDEQYPQLLKQTENPPIVLFTQGNIELLNKPQLAIVGSRDATFAAREHTRYFAAQLSSQLVITSGLALGIDTAAHRGALIANNFTIAVVGTGLDIVYPARNKTLANEILENNGCIVSENIPGSKPHPGCFPRRNRIVTGMALGVFVVEAKIKSGSLISARSALEQNREVFAMPGAINNEQSKGCHSLIKQGAILVDEVSDISNCLSLPNFTGLQQKQKKKSKKTGQNGLFIDELLSSVDYETTSVDMVVSRSQLPTEEVLTRLMTLELRGLVAAVPGGYIKLHDNNNNCHHAGT
ncbi:DNA-processing protein DprA [Thalassotalea crassostreae]|uniref:DNA-processing protein DprA n=1 Tax=Thalassotalea crassostreae TaxID=1763536 RepID=UPI00083861C8|nr:DNA-processing protein DprA [Thalassotalea crassostreae]